MTPHYIRLYTAEAEEIRSRMPALYGCVAQSPSESERAGMRYDRGTGTRQARGRHAVARGRAPRRTAGPRQKPQQTV
eukprot:1234901-Prymnesium_polylepis.1